MPWRASEPGIELLESAQEIDSFPGAREPARFAISEKAGCKWLKRSRRLDWSRRAMTFETGAELDQEDPGARV
jgi:hypothetical protein